MPVELEAVLFQGADVLGAEKRALNGDGPRFPLDGADDALAIPRSGKVLCMGLNYFDHAKKAARTVLTIHGFSCIVRRRYKAMDSLRSAPVWFTTFDYEVELAVIIDKTMRQAIQETALRYSAFDDMSLYDYQRKTPQ